MPPRKKQMILLIKMGYFENDLPMKTAAYAYNCFSILNNLENRIAAHLANGSETTLYDIQMDEFEQLRDFLEEGNREGLGWLSRAPEALN